MKRQHDYDVHKVMRMFTKCNPNLLMPKCQRMLGDLVDAQVSNCCCLGAKPPLFFFFFFFFFLLSAWRQDRDEKQLQDPYQVLVVTKVKVKLLTMKWCQS